MKISFKKQGLIGKQLWGIKKSGNNEPIICVHEERDAALKSLDPHFTELIEMRVTKVYVPTIDLANFKIQEEAEIVE